MAAKKKKAKKVKKIKKAKGSSGATVLKEKKALLTLRIGDKNSSKELKLGYTEFPADVPTSKVSVHTGATRNISGFDYIRVDVEIDDVTLANPKARAKCFDTLTDEALTMTVKAVKAAAKKLFQTNL